MIFLARRYKQKPRQWGPASAVSSAVIRNCETLGLPVPRVLFPLWEGQGSSAQGYGARPIVATLSSHAWEDGGVLDLSNTAAIMYCPAEAVYATKGAFYCKMTGVASPAMNFAKFFTFSDATTEVGFKLQRYNLDTVYRSAIDDGAPYSVDATGFPDAWGNGIWRAVSWSWWSTVGFDFRLDKSQYNLMGDDLFILSGSRSSYFCVGNRFNGLDRGLRAKWRHVMVFEAVLNAEQHFLLDENPNAIYAPTAQRSVFDMGMVPAAPTAHDLTADGITAGAPTLGAPAIGQVHALTASGITAGAPTLDAPALGQKHTLIAGGITAGPAVLGAPAIGQVHALTANEIVAGAPVLGNPAVGQIHALVADGITAGAPTLGSPELSVSAGVHSLVANDITAGAPVLGNPVLGQIHALIAGGILTGVPTLGAPALNYSITESPDFRTVFVAAENRAISIYAEPRVVIVNKQNRVTICRGEENG